MFVKSIPITSVREGGGGKYHPRGNVEVKNRCINYMLTNQELCLGNEINILRN